MKFSTLSSALLCIATFWVAATAQELNITNTAVFVQSGEATASSVVIMTRCNSERDSSVSVSYNSQSVPTIVTRTALAYRANDYTAKVLLTGLTSNTVYTYRVRCTINGGGPFTESVVARFRTLPSATEAVDLSFVWAADLAGQGWGRNPDLNLTTINGTFIKGGYLVFQVMQSLNPDYAFFQGDMIYADNLILPNRTIPAAVGGGIFNNNPTKQFVAQTLDDFRANWKYNFGDEKMQNFLARTPVYVQWDDHEVINNWFPTQVYSGPLIASGPIIQNGTAIDSMAENSLQAFYEFNPIPDGSLIYRTQRFGKHLEVFFVDLRSYRAPNPRNSDTTLAAMMGPTQLAWLKDRLLRSTATHKLLSMHDPLSIVTGGPGDYDAYGNNDARNLGRELELQDLLAFIKDRNIRNVNVLTSDVHFSAAISYDPSRATGGFTAFTPFDEFVIGPIHAGSFGPGGLDTSFGPQYVFSRGPSTTGLPGNIPPPTLSSFGQISLTAAGDLTIRIVDITGAILHSKTYAKPTELPLTTTDVFVQSGEVSTTTATLMARCNNAVNSAVTFSYNVQSGGAVATAGGSVTSATDYTLSVRVTGLTANTRYSYSATCVGSTGTKTSRVASFKTAPLADAATEVKFVWAADLAGQGWGRWPGLTVKDINNVDIVGGYPIFQTMQSFNPDFALFQGDMIYADNACPEYVVMPESVGGKVWYNNPSKPFVAVTLDDFRFNWKYNHGDAKMQSFLAQTPIYVQWDDHEVTNNWWPGEILGPPNYPNGTSANALASASLQAFYEFNPLLAGSLIYRRQSFGKHLEVFFVDMRSYRASNALASNAGNVDMFGATQLAWLLSALRNSTATWKILSMHDPISIITGGPGDYDAFGQDQCKVLGRENELTQILRTIKQNGIKNVVSLTSDVHFSAAIKYNPEDAVFKDFDPFYEFVIGPIHAGAFGPNELDGTFGPTYEFVYNPVTQGIGGANIPPPYLQTFGAATVTASGFLDVQIISVTGAVLYQKTLEPEVVFPCPPIFRMWNANTDALVSTLADGGTVASPPCSVNIEALLPCHNGTVTFELLSGNTVIRTRVERTAPFFLFGDSGTNILGGAISAGTYAIRVIVNGVALRRTTFTFGACV